MTPDWLLLRRFVEDNSQEAFAALTARYLNLVYSVCLREVHDPELASDVTQAVFLLLARTAPKIRSRTALPSWLFRTARFASQNARTREQRRRHYEEKAAQMMQPQAIREDVSWGELEPLLNQSLAALRGTERECVLLRFFQGMSFAETGAALGLSEDAARKRVTRSLEKMRRFFSKHGAIIPSTALMALLSRHAIESTPATCAAGVAHVTAEAVAGHFSMSLVGSHVYQLSQGALKAMKIAKMKVAAGSTALIVMGTAVSYGIVHGPAPDKKTAYRTAILKGKVRYENGKPAAGIRIGVQLQDDTEGRLLQTEKPGPASERMKQLVWNDTLTSADGTYTLAVGADIPYNIMIFPKNLDAVEGDDGWVAAAAEGVSGHKGHSVSVPALVLTHGGFVTGTITNKINGRAAEGATIGSYGPARPTSSAAIIYTHSDSTGHYRLRLAPGSNEVYVGDQRYNGLPDDEARAKGLSKTVTVVEGQAATANFQVVPNQAEPGTLPKIFLQPAK